MVKDNETMDESNVEKFIRGAIDSYRKKNLTGDAMFWRQVFVILNKKYKLKFRC